VARFAGANRRTAHRNDAPVQRIPLSLVADVREAKGPNVIFRENSQRRFALAIKPTVRDVSTRRAAAGGSARK
jgi:Cu/Ag efflux pump CusA